MFLFHVHQDAHNAVLNYTTASSRSALFAVFDGHGGAEVAEYAAKHLPDWIRELPQFKEGKYEEALIKGFVSFDERLTKPEVVAELKKLANIEDEGDVSEDERHEAELLREEANISLDELIRQYRSKRPTSSFKSTKSEKSDEAKASGSSSSSSSANNSSCKQSSSSDQKNSSDPIAGSSNTASSSSCSSASIKEEKESIVMNGSSKCDEMTSSNKDEESDTCKNSKDEKETSIPQSTEETVNSSSASSAPENGASYTGKGKHKKPVVSRPKREKKVDPKTSYEKFLEDFEDGGDDDDDDDDDSEDSMETHNNKPFDSDDSDESAGSDDDDEDDDDDDDDEDDSDSDAEETDVQLSVASAEFPTEEPGQDSGCTAVVAIVIDDKIYVANAGDSRCVVSSGGKAIDMSVDHKPEDTIESDRIKKAGGKVTFDGRVNGGLNLSRALGDHVYKNNNDLPLEEQMISPLPDVKVIDLDSKVDFMILACDGIWNCMTSQEAVDFIAERIKRKKKANLSSICVELFNHCLAPDTSGDGTGCDNMTAIIVDFKGRDDRKRKIHSSDEDDNEADEKKAKTSGE